MGTWQEYWDQFCSYNRDQLVAIAKDSFNKVYGYLCEVLEDDDKAFEILMYAVGTFFAADEDIDQDEYTFFQQILGCEVTPEQFVAVAKSGVGIENEVDELVDNFPGDVKEAFTDLGCCIACCNGWLTAEEKALIRKYHEE